MVPITSLWLPILVSAVFVFIASSVFHMLLPFHKRDVRKTPREDELQASLRGFSLPPGDYAIPRAGSMADMKNPVFVEKLTKGPVVFMTVAPAGRPSMGSSLAQWFLYAIVVGIFAAYIAGRALGPGAPYLQVHRFAGATAFIGYSVALAEYSIWYK